MTLHRGDAHLHHLRHLLACTVAMESRESCQRAIFFTILIRVESTSHPTSELLRGVREHVLVRAVDLHLRHAHHGEGHALAE